MEAQISIRLPDHVRRELDARAEYQGLKTSQLIRSILVQLAREYRQKDQQPETAQNVAPVTDTTDIDFLMAAETVEPRRDA